MTPATLQNLVEAFKSHRMDIQKIERRGQKLLCFYAAECGIKALYLSKYNFADTGKIPSKMFNSEKGHAIDFWIKELKLPRTASFIEVSNGEDYPLKRLHERLRYGIPVPREIESSQIAYLNSVVEMVYKEIKKIKSL